MLNIIEKAVKQKNMGHPFDSLANPNTPFKTICPN
jgi:hypothetical protein